VPISGRAGTAPTLEPQESYPPARSTALACYAAAGSRIHREGSGTDLSRNTSSKVNWGVSATKNPSLVLPSTYTRACLHAKQITNSVVFRLS
jgi:hypothetical protein